MNEQTLSVTGMTFADCARHVEKALKTLTDIVAADVAYPHGVAHIRTIQPLRLDQLNARSDERRVGSVCVSTCCSRWSPYHYKYYFFFFFFPLFFSFFSFFSFFFFFFF